MKLLVPPPGLTEASCFAWGESGFVAGALEVPAPEGCCAEASAGMARAVSHKARAREKKSGVRSEIFCNINSPWMSAVEWNALTGLGSQAFRASRDCPRKHRDCQLGRFIPAKTTCPGFDAWRPRFDARR